MTIVPLLPLLELPVLKTSIPLVPAEPAFMLRTVTTPLLVAVPSPLASTMAPPVLTELRPAEPCKEPPTALVPLPIAKIRLPPRPEEEAPEPSKIEPLLPLLELPELKTSTPLTPEVPELRLRTITAPLVVEVPSPEAIERNPPELTVLRPE